MKILRTSILCFVALYITFPLLSIEDSFFDDLQKNFTDDLNHEQDERKIFFDLYRLHRFFIYFSDPSTLDSYFKRIEQNPDLSPLIKAESAYIRLLYSIRTGRIEEALRLKEDLGFLSDWFIIGPFENENKTGYRAAYPPEDHVIPPASCRGIMRDVSWQYVTNRSPRPFLHLASYIYPSDDYVAYAMTYIRCETDMKAVLKVSVKDAFKIWVNDKEVMAVEDYNTGHFDQYAVGLHLTKGFNKFLLKCSVNQGGGNFCARLTRPDGSPLRGYQVDPLEGNQFFEPPDSREVNVFSDYEDLSTRFSGPLTSDDATGFDHFLQGFFLFSKKNFDKEDRLDGKSFERAIDPDSRDPWLFYYLSKTRRDDNRARQDLETGMKAVPGFTPAALILAQTSHRKGFINRAIEILDRLLETRGNAPPALLRRALYVSQATGMPDTLKKLEDMRESFRTYPLYGLILGKIYQNLGMKKQAISAFDRFLAVLPYDKDIILKLIRLLSVDEAGFKRSLRLLDRSIEINPDDLSLRYEKISLLNEWHQLQDAYAETAKALELNGDHPLFLEMAGKLLHQLDRSDEGLKYLLRSLEIKTSEHFPPGIRGVSKPRGRTF